MTSIVDGRKCTPSFPCYLSWLAPLRDLVCFFSWDVPLLGVVPDEPYLARPSLIDLEKIFKTKLLAGLENRRHPHYSIKHTHLAATGAYVCCGTGDPSFVYGIVQAR